MASRTEEAIRALASVLAAKASEPGPKLTVPSRNEGLPTRCAVYSGAIGGFLNLLDGTGGPEGPEGGVFIGADAAGFADGYEIVQRSEIELVIEAADNNARDLAFDD